MPRYRSKHCLCTQGKDHSDQKDVNKMQVSGGDQVELKKEIGLAGAVGLVVSGIVGSGIFISTRGVVEGVGSVGLSLVLWTVCGIITLCSSLSLVELSSFIDKPGGNYAYIHAAFGSLPAFVYVWLMVLVLNPASTATVAYVFSEYSLAPFLSDRCDVNIEYAKKMVAVCGIMIVCGINLVSVKLANKLSVVAMVVKVVALLVIIGGGLFYLGTGHTQNLNQGFTGSTFRLSGIATAVYNCMWAYDGWGTLYYAAQEVYNPIKNIPRAIIIGMPLVTALYVLANISYLSVLTVEEVLLSPAIAVTWGERLMPFLSWMFPLFVGMSAFGSIHTSMFAGIRVVYAGAREGHMPQSLCFIQVTMFTPLVSTLTAGLLGMLMIIPSDIGSLINIVNFTVWMSNGMVAAGVIIMRRTHRDVPRTFKVPIAIPILTIVTSVFLVVVPLTQDPQVEYLFALAIIGMIIIAYIPFVHYKKSLPCMGQITRSIQLILQAAPPEDGF